MTCLFVRHRATSISHLQTGKRRGRKYPKRQTTLNNFTNKDLQGLLNTSGLIIMAWDVHMCNIFSVNQFALKNCRAHWAAEAQLYILLINYTILLDFLCIKLDKWGEKQLCQKIVFFFWGVTKDKLWGGNKCLAIIMFPSMNWLSLCQAARKKRKRCLHHLGLCLWVLSKVPREVMENYDQFISSASSGSELSSNISPGNPSRFLLQQQWWSRMWRRRSGVTGASVVCCMTSDGAGVRTAGGFWALAGFMFGDYRGCNWGKVECFSFFQS